MSKREELPVATAVVLDDLQLALQALGQEVVVSLLLQDIVWFFQERNADWLRTCDLLEGLRAVEGRPWAGMTSTKLAKLLRFKFIRPEVRRDGTKFARGYKRRLIEDALNGRRG